MGGTPIELEVAGLPTRPALYRTLALGVGGVIVLFMLTAIVLRPRVGQRQALVQRRDLLMSALRDLPEDAVAERDQVLRRLDRVYRQLDAVTPSGGAGSESEPAK